MKWIISGPTLSASFHAKRPFVAKEREDKWISELEVGPGVQTRAIFLIFYFLLPSFFPLGTKDWMDGPWIHLHRPSLTRETEPHMADWNEQYFSFHAFLMPPAAVQSAPYFSGNTSLPVIELHPPLLFFPTSLLVPESHKRSTRYLVFLTPAQLGVAERCGLNICIPKGKFANANEL